MTILCRVGRLTLLTHTQERELIYNLSYSDRNDDNDHDIDDDDDVQCLPTLATTGNMRHVEETRGSTRVQHAVAESDTFRQEAHLEQHRLFASERTTSARYETMQLYHRPPGFSTACQWRIQKF